VTTPWLRLLNRLRELARGGGKHGSCGQGIGEARSYWLRYGADAVFAADLREPQALRHKLELQRQRASWSSRSSSSVSMRRPSQSPTCGT